MTDIVYVEVGGFILKKVFQEDLTFLFRITI